VLTATHFFGVQTFTGSPELLVQNARRVRTENSILAMKSPFSADAAPISSSN
jgi:hypothetical protein